MSLVCKSESNPFLDGSYSSGTCDLVSESTYPENIIDLTNVPLPRGGTEVESALRLIEAAQNGDITPLSLQELSIELIQQLKDQVGPLFKIAKEKGLITMGSAGWNLFQLVKLGFDIKKGNYFENRAIVSAHGPTLARGEILSDIQQQLFRHSLKASVFFIRTMKGATLLISDPITKKIAQASCDATSHALTLHRDITTKAPELQRNPRAVTWKDTAHKVAVNTLTAICLVGSLVTLASSLDMVDEESSAYAIATKGALVSGVMKIGYGVLQQVGVFNKRD